MVACTVSNAPRTRAACRREAALDLFHKPITTYGLAAFIGAVSLVKKMPRQGRQTFRGVTGGIGGPAYERLYPVARWCARLP